MTAAPFPVLYEDNHLLAIVKPPMLPTMGVAPGKPSALEMARQYIKNKYDKPGNVYLGTVSRLDAPVTGVLLFARTSKSANRLTDQFRRRDVEKAYWAIVDGDLAESAGEYVDWVRKDERHRRMHIARQGDAGAKLARLSYRTICRLPRGALLEILLETGRKHQIRLQLGHRGCPVLGDRKYGSRQPFPVGIALLARRLAFTHPVRGEPIELVAPVPDVWQKFGVAEPGRNSK